MRPRGFINIIFTNIDISKIIHCLKVPSLDGSVKYTPDGQIGGSVFCDSFCC